MQVTFESGEPAQAVADALIVPVGSGSNAPAWSPLANELDEALSGELSRLATDAHFSGKTGTTLVIPTLGRIPSRRIILAGFGPANTVTTRRVGRNFWMVGDGESSAGPGQGLMAPRVGIAAHHQANAALRLLLGEEPA